MYANKPSYQQSKLREDLNAPVLKADQADHRSVRTEQRKRFRFCQSYAIMTCEKCKITVCQNGTRNCSKNFHIA